MAPDNCSYAKSHEWVRLEGATGVIGITDHAADELGDVTFLEFPPVGKEVKAGESLGTVESVKAASEIYAPVGGKILEVNAALEEAPELINEDSFGAGWMLKIAVADASEVDNLMDAAAYEKYLAELED